MAQRKEKVSGHTIVISNKFYILYNFDNDDEDNDKNTQKTTKKSDTFDIHDEAQDAEIEERGKVVRGRRKVSAQDHPHKTPKKVMLLTYMTKHKMLNLKKGVKW